MVTMEIRADAQAAQAATYERFMRDEHVPAVWATGCFARIDMERGDGGLFLIRYTAASDADLARYLADHAPHFRAEFAERFADASIVVRRLHWQHVQSWTRSAGA